MPQDIELTSQQDAITGHDPSWHARVLAGPGTGKSFTAMVWMGLLGEDRPDLRSKLLTFTRAATSEFANKLVDAGLSEDLEAPSTVHSHALSVLMGMKGHGLPSPVRIPDDWETKELVHPDLAQRMQSRGHYATPTQIGKLEREMAAGWQTLDPERRLLSDIDPALRNAYLGMWREHRAVFGYSLLAELTYRAAQAVEDLGDDYPPNINLLLVDEYQDLNHADIRFIAELAARGVTVIAIGDDDQSIYGWRHAAPEGIRQFLKQFESEADYPLTVSRRCGRNILDAANELIETAPDRAPKPRLTPMDGTPAGRYGYLRFPSTKQEAEGVARVVGHRVNTGVEPADILLLVRSNLDTWHLHLEPALAAHDVEIGSAGWVSAALADPELRRGVALGRLAENPEDSLAWWTIAIKLNPQVGPSVTDYVYDQRHVNETWGEALLRLYAIGFPDLGEAKTKRLGEAIQTTRETLRQLAPGVELDERGWGGWLLEQLDTDVLGEDAHRLLELVGAEVDPREGLTGFLNQLGPLGRDLALEEGGGVRLMTMGGSKGLTANTCIVMGVEEGIVPLARPGVDVNEERRLLYVAMTRATDLCLLTFASRRRGQLARVGRPQVGAARGRSPLLADLQAGQYADGPAAVAELA